jgi:hypothetical protein
MEKFVTLVTSQLLPKIEAFVKLNKDKLAASFQVAAEMAFKLLTVAIAFSDWCANNMGLVKGMAAIIVGMFAVGRIAAFVTAIQTIVAALVILRTTAVGAAIATALATGGSNLALGTAAIAAASGYLYFNQRGDSSPAPKKGISPRGNANNRDFSVDPYVPPVVKGLEDFTTGLNASTNALKKATTLQDKITAEAVRQNLARQKSLSGSTALAVGQGGRLYMPNSGVNVAVKVEGSVVSNEDLVTSIVNGIERTTRRSFGTVGAFDIL